MNDGNNTTIYPVEVAFGGQIYRPEFWIGDNGTWSIKGHGAMKDAMDRHDRECGQEDCPACRGHRDTYNDFLIWFWSTEEGRRHIGGRRAS